MATPGDREDLFLDLLRRLTEAHPDWILLKDPDSAFHGAGDVDASLPTGGWDVAEATFKAWARDRGLSPVIVCNHGSLGRLLATFRPGHPEMLELDLLRGRGFRGAMLFTAEDLTGMTVVDPRGFRALRPGAEGVFKLVWNGIRYGGRRNEAGIRIKHVQERLASDPEGVRMALAMLHDAGPDAGRVVKALLDGRWDRRAALRLEIRFLLRALRHAGRLVPAMRFKFWTLRTCPVFVVMAKPGRVTPDDFDAWLVEVERTHEVVRAVA